MSIRGVWVDNGHGENILWNANSPGKLLDSFNPKIKVLGDCISVSAEKFGSRNCVGYRKVTSREFVDVKGKKFEKLKLENEFTWTSYSGFHQRIKDFGSGLVSFAGLKAKDRVIIYAETQQDWMTTAFACWTNALSVVTAYATLGAEGAAFAITSTKCSTVVADAKLLKVLVEVKDKISECVKFIVTINEVEKETKATLEDCGIKIATFDDLVKSGAESPNTPVPPEKDDVAVIMFTSGTTGNPKGVRLSHANLIAAAAGAKKWIDSADITENDVYCAYLPLAHIMEIIAEISNFALGVALGYANPHTLTATGVKLAPGQIGDFSVLKPTFVVFAPAVLEKIYNAITMKTSGLTGIKKVLFDWGKASGEANFDRGVVGASWLYNTVLFKKIQALVGGRLRAALTGSAPLDSGVHKFIQTALCIPIRQGYGTTETCAASVIQDVDVNVVGSVGAPLESCCIKLRDWEEGGYRRTDVTNPKIGKERGEIVLGGPAITLGYLVDEENPDPAIVKKNEEEFEVDANGIRWFFTGDIGEVDKDGTLSIIDRKKDLVKLQMGEYVSLSKVEGVVKTASLVENALVHADPTESYCTVLVVPFAPALAQLAAEKKLGDNMEEVAVSEEVNKAVLAQIHQVCQKLARFEIPKKVTVLPPSKAWTPENSLLTAAMKLKRVPIHKAHAEEIAAMYKK